LSLSVTPLPATAGGQLEQAGGDHRDARTGFVLDDLREAILASFEADGGIPE
jgi:hypothetical protein